MTMPDIHFECPQCAQPIDAPLELANELTDCPTCKAKIEVPARSRPAPPPPVPQSLTSPKNPVARVSASPLSAPASQLIEVVVKDFDMSFGSMVFFMIKWALASVPALLLLASILAGIGFAVSIFLAILGVLKR